MAVQTRTYSSTTDVITGATIAAAHINTDLDKLYTLQNAGLDTTNLSPTAGITAAQTAIGTFTAWTTWTPGYTGFSANPTPTAARYTQIGKMLTVVYNDQTAPGTSNLTTFTITGLPVASVKEIWFPLSLAMSNGTRINTGVGTIAAGGTIVSCFADHVTPAAWNGAGSKGAGCFTISYEVA